jgi:hypothetical protein
LSSVNRPISLNFMCSPSLFSFIHKQ